MISQYYPQSTQDIVDFDYLKRGVYEVLEKQLLTDIELITQNLMCKTMTSDAIGAISNIVFGDSSIRDPDTFIEKINEPKGGGGEEGFIRRLDRAAFDYDVLVESVTDSRPVSQVRNEDKFRLVFEYAIHIFEDLKPKPDAKLLRKWFDKNNIPLTTHLTKNDCVVNAPQNVWSVMFNKGIHIFDHMGVGRRIRDGILSGTVDDFRSGKSMDIWGTSNDVMFSGYREAGIIDVIGKMYSWDALSTLSREAATLPINLKVMYFGWANGKLGEWDDGEKSMNRNPVCHGASGILVLYGDCYD